MAVGNQTDASTIHIQAAADAQQIASFYAWVKRRLIQWSTNAGNAAQLAGYGITSSADQAQVFQLISNLNVLMETIEGTQTNPNTHPLITDVAQLVGLL